MKSIKSGLRPIAQNPSFCNQPRPTIRSPYDTKLKNIHKHIGKHIDFQICDEIFKTTWPLAMTKPFNFWIKLEKIRNQKYISQGSPRFRCDFGAPTAAISSKIPSSAMPHTDHMVVFQPIIQKKHWKPDGLKQIIFSKTSKSTRDVTPFFTKSYEIDQKWPSANYPKSKFLQSTRTDHSVSLWQKVHQHPQTYRKTHWFSHLWWKIQNHMAFGHDQTIQFLNKIRKK